MAKILIVEDDALLSRMYEKIFSSNNYEVVTAADGQEGLNKAGKEKFTLILLDVMMPKLNGIEVLKSLKAKAGTKNIPVIILTNLSGTADAEEAMKLGAVKYIVKSEHKPKEVADMVKEILAGYTRNEIPKSGVHTDKA